MVKLVTDVVMEQFSTCLDSALNLSPNVLMVHTGIVQIKDVSLAHQIVISAKLRISVSIVILVLT